MCVIRGTIQTGSKDNLSLSIYLNTYFFRNKVPWRSPGKGGTSPLYRVFVHLEAVDQSQQSRPANQSEQTGLWFQTEGEQKSSTVKHVNMSQ